MSGYLHTFTCIEQGHVPDERSQVPVEDFISF